jgi:hypothetical protein
VTLGSFHSASREASARSREESDAGADLAMMSPFRGSVRVYERTGSDAPVSIEVNRYSALLLGRIEGAVSPR